MEVRLRHSYSVPTDTTSVSRRSRPHSAPRGRVRAVPPWPSPRRTSAPRRQTPAASHATGLGLAPPTLLAALFESGLGNGYRLGALTSGEDLIGRHAYVASYSFLPSERHGRRRGLPVRGLRSRARRDRGADWELRAQLAGGDVRRRTRDAVLTATISAHVTARPRAPAGAGILGGTSPSCRLAFHSAHASATARGRRLQLFRVRREDSWGNATAAPTALPEDGVTRGATRTSLSRVLAAHPRALTSQRPRGTSRSTCRFARTARAARRRVVCGS